MAIAERIGLPGRHNNDNLDHGDDDKEGYQCQIDSVRPLISLVSY